jgi:class 3 adenylate cyclase/tetratricopeptide (TPR) repeat protein
MKFCGECGTSLIGAPSPTPTVPPVRETPTEERRLVSVLFADLVAFTTLSESRDPEEVRDLLSRYFDTCRRIVERYGGVVEKFIGDAVMAVWGSPIATEDDAERAVRAAMEVVDAVTAFGLEVGLPELQARAGVLTGEAAVNVGAESEGMVLGDMVNTASRIQSTAKPGQVLVGDATRRATASTFLFEDVGAHEMKGKSEPQQLWRPTRLLNRDASTGLEPPFVGRERELRLVKETLHASADERRAHLVSAIGPAGIGKSRLSIELERYVEGLAEDLYWHRGRCPSYGDGLTYWALVEMVKWRCGIAEEESGEPAGHKLRTSLAEIVPDPEERDWIEPRLARLLSLEDTGSIERDELFHAWRLFFERMADISPTILVFEDLQWADSGLLDFIEYLLEWSRNSRLLVLTLARPELMERRPNWAAGQRNVVSLYLEPLGDAAMSALLAGLVPGLPVDISSQILARAQGVPLYAVETVRMLLDQDLLQEEGGVYRPTGPIEDLEVPETLQALIAARLDGLSPEERQLVLDASVLGKSFFPGAVAAVGGRDNAEADRILEGLARKEIVRLETDPQSPERGQFTFLQDLMRQVAYGTIGRRDRKDKHLSAATFMRDTWRGDQDEIVEVVASHLLQAFELDPSAEDAAAIREAAIDMLRKAGDRASSLGATREAQTYYERAAALWASASARIPLLELAGEMALAGGRLDEAKILLRDAYEGCLAQNDLRGAARAAAQLGEAELLEGGLDEAIERMDRMFATFDGERSEEFAELAAQLGRLHYFTGNLEASSARLETALAIAEPMGYVEVVAQALNTKGIVAIDRLRPQESVALTGHALDLAVEHGLTGAALRAYNNHAENLYLLDRYDASVVAYEEGIALARRVGNHLWVDLLTRELPAVLFLRGGWQEALDRMEELSLEGRALGDNIGSVVAVPAILTHRGDLDGASKMLDAYARYELSRDSQDRSAWLAGRAAVMNGRGEHAEAYDAAMAAIETSPARIAIMVKVGAFEAIEAAAAVADAGRVRQVVDIVAGPGAGMVSPLMAALEGYGLARAASLTGDREAGSVYETAAERFRAVGMPFWLGATLARHADWLIERGEPRDAAPLLAEARSIFGDLGATVWLDRVDALG